MEGIDEGALAWRPPTWREVVRWPVPGSGLGGRLLLRTVTLAGKRQVRALHGLENILPERDPFILVANHGTLRDTVVAPAFLFLHRGGRPIHFLADWNYRLLPGVGMLYRAAGVITVARKPARPRPLNVFKRFYEDPVPSIERARRHLAAGRSVGFFPEGTINRDPARLLAGRHGAARLSLETGVPVVPMGVRFPAAEPGAKASGPIEIFIAPAMMPPAIDDEPAAYSTVRAWHAALMSAVARLSGKAWKSASGESTWTSK